MAYVSCLKLYIYNSVLQAFSTVMITGSTQRANFCLVRLFLLYNAETHELQAVADALAAVAPVSVLWKLTVADQHLLGIGNVTLASNIHVIEWAPQNDVLGHPATRAFLTQAGTNSFNEVWACHATLATLVCIAVVSL